jgi:ADP-ribose pyrophosphatase YjhB (NUDIX family)
MISEEHYIKDSHCGFCGDIFHLEATWPKHCMSCKNLSYKNPIPVVQVLYIGSTKDEHGYNKYGLLIQQRNIEPKKGEWALPGGYMNLGETWQQAAARELEEETGLVTDPNDYALENIQNSSNGNLLIFVINRSWKDITDFVLKENDEVQAAKFIFEAQTLAFPTHTEEVAKAIQRLKNYTAVMEHGVYL